MSEPIDIIPAAAAYANLDHPASRYPKPDRGKERLVPLANIVHEPVFSIDQDDQIFAIGSCFAREIERAMMRLGFDVVSKNLGDVGAGEDFQWLRNKFTTKSILQDLKWALDGATDDELAATYATSDDGKTWTNLGFGGSHATIPVALDELLVAHRLWLEQIALIRNCRVVVMTLGLSEAWYDSRTGTYTNIAPTRQVVASDPERYQMHVLSYPQLLEDLEACWSLLRKHCRADQKMLLTVSPVPLHATFRGQDVMTANCYSKSTLRAVAEAFCMAHGDVAYFPSYEIVTLADRKEAWVSADYRHVNSTMVDHIMHAAMSAYVEGIALMPTRHAMQAMVLAKQHAAVVEVFEANGGLGEVAQSYALHYAGICYTALGDMKLAEGCLRLALERSPKNLQTMIRLGRVLVRTDRPTEALQLANRALQHNPKLGIALKLRDRLTRRR